jgi:triosephosphate isomerase
MSHKIVVANWKMNPESPREAKELFAPIKRVAAKFKKIHIVVCPPAIFLPVLGANSSNLSLGGQDAFWDITGPYTGALSPAMIKKAGAEYVILGHSERRAAGDTDEIINRKLKTALAAGLQVIVCVGEKERLPDGSHLKTIEAQLLAALQGVPKKLFGRLLIAYEPVWAIGTAATGVDTPPAFLEQAIFIRKIISGVFGYKPAMAVPILYGGSVTPENAEGFLSEGKANGLLVGRASLRADHFMEILKIAETCSH